MYKPTPPKVQTVDIDWKLDWNNSPEILITVVTMPPLSDYVFKAYGNFYLGYCGDLAKFYYHDPKDQSGYGGAAFTLPMADGTVKTIVGPWSSNSSQANKVADFEHDEVVECVINNLYSEAVQVGALRGKLPQGVELRAINTHYGRYWMPCVKGYPAKAEVEYRVQKRNSDEFGIDPTTGRLLL